MCTYFHLLLSQADEVSGRVMAETWGKQKCYWGVSSWMCNLIDLQTDLDIEECPNIILDSLESTMFL
jgi:hypothetical protein